MYIAVSYRTHITRKMDVSKFVLLLYFVLLYIHQLKCCTQDERNKLDKKCISSENSTLMGKCLSLQFNLPFIDMEMEHKHNFFITQEILESDLYIVYGHELYLMKISHTRKEIFLIGFLTGNLDEKKEKFNVQVIKWDQYLLLVIAMDEDLEIYQLDIILNKDRNMLNFTKDTVSRFDPIQQLTLLGKYQEHVLIVPTKDRLMLLVTEGITNTWDKYRSFEWKETFFAPIEEVSIPSISTLSVFGSNLKYLIVGRIAKSNNGMRALSMYEIKLPSLKLKRRQTLTVLSHSVHAFTYKHTNYLITCGLNKNKCNFFCMKNGQFEIYMKRSGDELGFNIIKATKHFLMGVYKNEVRVYCSANLDCYSSLKSNITSTPLLFAHLNAKGEEFIVLHYRYINKSIFRVAKMSIETEILLGSVTPNITEKDDANDNGQKMHQFEDSISKLRSALLKRKFIMDEFYHIASRLSPKLSIIRLPHSLRILNGSIGLVKVVGKNISSPVQIIQLVQYKRNQNLQLLRLRRSLKASTKNITKLKVQHLIVRQLQYGSDILTGFYVDNIMHSKSVLYARQKICTETMISKIVIASKMYTQYQLQLSINTTLHVIRLKVQEINGIHLANLYKSFYIKKYNTNIKGLLTLRKLSNVVQLRTVLLNDVPMECYFNLVQPQIVLSTIFIFGFLLNKLMVKRVNNLDIIDNLVLNDEHIFVEGHVILYEATVVSDIFLDYNYTKHQYRTLNRDNIIETQQLYTSKVIINGSLTINKLYNKEVFEIILPGVKPLSIQAMKSNFILNNTVQFIKTGVSFGNDAKIITSAFKTESLNSYYTNHYLLNTPLQIFRQLSSIELASMLMFINAHFNNGDVVSLHLSSKLIDITQQVVRLGSVANITGSKFFKHHIMVNLGYTLILNQMVSTELVLTSQVSGVEDNITFNSNKSFNSISVMDGFKVFQVLNANYINNMLLNTLLYYKYYFKSLTIPFTLYTTNVIFDCINSDLFDELFQQLQINANKLTLHKILYIVGNSRFFKQVHVHYINDFIWKTYVSDLVLSNENDINVIDKKRFLHNLTIAETLQTHLLKNINLLLPLKHVLVKSNPQEIIGKFTFSSIDTDNIDVSVINDASTSGFLNIFDIKYMLFNNLNIAQLIVLGNMTGIWLHSFNLPSIHLRINALSQYNWCNVNVLNSISWKTINLPVLTPVWQQQFAYMQHNAVKHSGQQNITGNIRLRSPYIHDIRTPKKCILTRDFIAIANDMLHEQSKSAQHIKASKNFLRSLQMYNFQLNRHFSVTQLNNINIKLFNNSLWRISAPTPVVGPLHFQMVFNIAKLNLSGSVNDLHLRNIYNNHLNKTLPVVKILKLNIRGQLMASNINSVYVHHLLEKHIPKYYKSVIEANVEFLFEQLELSYNMIIQTINGITIHNIIFNHNKNLQTVRSIKNIRGDLVLIGPTHVIWLNGEHLIDAYHHTVFITNKYNYEFKHILVEVASFEIGLLLTILSDNFTSRNSDIKKDIRPNLLQHNLLYLDNDNTTKIHWHKNNMMMPYHVVLLTHVSPCECRMLQIQWENDDYHLYLKNVTSNTLISVLDDITVMIENFCKPYHGKLHSKIKIAKNNCTRVFGMKKNIERVMVQRSEENDIFVILHGAKDLGMQNEIRILRLDNAFEYIHNWQTIRCGVSKTVQLLTPIAFQQFTKPLTLLIITKLLKDKPILNIYTCVNRNRKFILLQTIHGEYDIMQLVRRIDGEQQLILSCRQSQQITIYVRKSMSKPFTFMQTLKHNVSIDRFILFPYNYDQWYMLVLSDNEPNYYHLYKYFYVNGWSHISYSYYQRIHMAVPLITNSYRPQKPLNLLLCVNDTNCELVIPKLHYT